MTEPRAMEIPIPEDLRELSAECESGKVEIVRFVRIGNRNRKTILVSLLRQLLQRIAKAEAATQFKNFEHIRAERDKLKEQLQAQRDTIERLSAPVSVKEWWDNQPHDQLGNTVHEDVTLTASRVLASRAGQP